MEFKFDENHLVLISIMLQLLDRVQNTNDLNPNVQEYINGLCEEFKEVTAEEEGYYEAVYYYADIFFNKLYGAKETLH